MDAAVRATRIYTVEDGELEAHVYLRADGKFVVRVLDLSSGEYMPAARVLPADRLTHAKQLADFWAGAAGEPAWMRAGR